MGDIKMVHAVAILVKRRAEMFTWSYKTAWDNWVEDEEKQGFKYEQVKVYLK